LLETSEEYTQRLLITLLKEFRDMKGILRELKGKKKKSKGQLLSTEEMVNRFQFFFLFFFKKK